MIRNTPLNYGERLNRDLGIYAQDFVAAQPADRQRRHPLGERQGAGAGQRVAGRPVRPGAELRRRSRTCPTGRTGRRASALSTTCSATARRRSSTRSTATTRSAPPASPPTTTRSSPRRCTLPWRDVNGNDIAEGERGCTGYPTRRLRDRLHVACRRTSASRRSTSMATTRAPGTSRTRSRCSTSCCPAVGVGRWFLGQLPQPDDDHQPELVAGRLHAVHLLQPAHRRSRSRSSPQRCASQASDAQPRHLRPRARSSSTSRSTPSSGGACRGAARSSAAAASSASASSLHGARRPELRRRADIPQHRTTPAARSATTSRSTSRGGRGSSCRRPRRSAGASTSAWRSRATRARPARAR